MFFIGLCNNEAKYDNTPHNIGKIFLIYLKQFCDEKLIHEETTIDQKYTLYIYSYSNLKIKILLLNGYINHSGVNLYTIKDKIKLENFNEEILAIYDDITLDTGIFKLFINKGTNQHNGIKN
ncbi:Peptidyl-tRNA hydrolase [bacterium AB1]|nr:Peptidyl-tRNA hydrolase [bacterium AB1]